MMNSTDFRNQQQQPAGFANRTQSQFWFGNGEDKSFNFGSEASLGSFMKTFLNGEGTNPPPANFSANNESNPATNGVESTPNNMMNRPPMNGTNTESLNQTNRDPPPSAPAINQALPRPEQQSRPAPNAVEQTPPRNRTDAPLVVNVNRPDAAEANFNGSSKNSNSSLVRPNYSNNKNVISDARQVNSPSNSLVTVSNGVQYVDITEYLNLPQTIAAKKLDIPTSTLSKRWKEAARKRKWPYRTLCKLDKEITTLLHNMPQGPNAGSLPQEVEQALGYLLKKRQEELRPVVIRL